MQCYRQQGCDHVQDQLLQKNGNNSTSKVSPETITILVETNLIEETIGSFEATPQHKVQELVESVAPKVCPPAPKRRPPVWHSEYVTERNFAYCLLTEDEKPSTFHEATSSL